MGSNETPILLIPRGKKQAADPDIQQMSDWTDRAFQVALMIIFKELETTPKEVKEGIMTITHQIQNINKETGIVGKKKKKHLEILEFKVITEMKITTEARQ